MPTLTSNAALKQSPSSAIERWLTGATRSHLFLLVFFGVGILAAVIGFSHRGGDMLAYPLFAWSPFMLVLGLQQLTQGLRKIRETGAPVKVPWRTFTWEVIAAICAFSFAWYLHSAWSIFLLSLGAQQLTQGFRKSRDMAGLMMAAVCEGSWLILMAVGLFALACYLHSIVPLTGK
jgi:hypothetical protein